MPAQIQPTNILDAISTAEGIRGKRIANKYNQNILDWQPLVQASEFASAQAEGARKAAGETRAQEKHKSEMTEKDLDFLKTRMEIAKHFIPQVQQQTYPGYLDWMTNTLKLPSKGFLSPEQVQQMNPEQFEQYKNKLAQDADALNQLNLEQMKAKLPKVPKEGETREIQKGEQTVTEAYEGGKWVEKGKGPKWEPEAGKVPEKVKEARQVIGTIRRQVDDSTATILASMIAGDRFDPQKAAEAREKIPEELRGVYEAAIKTLKEHYGIDEGNDPLGIR